MKQLDLFRNRAIDEQKTCKTCMNRVPFAKESTKSIINYCVAKVEPITGYTLISINDKACPLYEDEKDLFKK